MKSRYFKLGSRAGRVLVLFACAVSTALSFGANQPIQLRNRPIDTARTPSILQTSGALARQVRATLSGLYLVQFSGPFQSAWQGELASLGVELLQYVPKRTFVVRCVGADVARLDSLDYVTWMGALEAADKVMSGWNGGDVHPVRVLLSRDVTEARIQEVEGLLNRVERQTRSRFGTWMQGELAVNNLARLSQSDWVLWVEPAPRMQLLGEISSKVVGGNNGTPGTPTTTQAAGFDGSGVTVAVVDTGLSFGEVDFIHPDLGGRVDAFFGYGGLPSAADEHGHGTHVAGILAGNATVGEADAEGHLFGLGLVPKVNLVVQRIFDNFGGYHPPESFAALTRDAVRAGAVIGSNSWGDDTQGRYDLSAMEFDALVRDADPEVLGDQPYILSFSVGNAGPGAQTVYSPAVAKNVITTGASQNSRTPSLFYDEGPDAMADFSSRGPCEDGRIKPDLVAPGTWVASARSALAPDESFWGSISPHYAYMGGTSQAAPLTSGAAAAFVQFYRELTGGETPSPALVKAALINSAADMDDAQGTGPVPNNDEGWGRIDLERLLISSRRQDFLDQSVSLGAGTMHVQRVLVQEAGQPLKITLAYTDVPGFPGAIPALMNDLDLAVVGPDGRRYQGNQFQNGESVPDRPVPDRVNNVEAVHLNAPLAGEYEVQVLAHRIVGDATSGTPQVDQDFALVVAGSLVEVGTGVVALDRAAYSVPGVVGIRLVDADLAGRSLVDVEVVSNTEPDGERLTLAAADAAGAFTNTMELSTESAATDGLLQVVHGDWLEVRYTDEAPPAIRTSTALVDMLPPTISQLAVTNSFGAAVISWTTDEPAASTLAYGTNRLFDAALSSTVFSTSHEVVLKNLDPGVEYEFRLISEDRAGNLATNDNGGLGFTFVVEPVKTLLVVDAYTPDPWGTSSIDFPLTMTTDTLDAVGIGYEVWMVSERGSPLAEDLSAYSAVMWRFNDNPLSEDTLSLPQQAALGSYVEQGGSLFIAGMELLTRIGNVPFRRDVLQVEAFVEDAGVPSAVGVELDPVAEGMSLALDYTLFDSDILQFIGQPPDVADTMTITSDAVPMFLEPSSGGVVGLRYPQLGSELPGRVVYLSFPIEAISTSATSPNTQADLVGRIFEFLVPGAEGRASLALDRPAYTLPSVVYLELGDADLASQSSASITVRSDSDQIGVTAELVETERAGLFRGTLNLTSAGGTGAGDALEAQAGDLLWAEYQDVSEGTTVRAEAVIDVEQTSITGVTMSPGYQSAEVQWQTSEPADTLVQVWESSAQLPVNRTFYLSAMVVDHSIELQGLEPDRLYYFQVVSRDAAGNATTDDNQGDLYAFSTLQPLVVPWTDDLEGDTSAWSVFSVDGSEVDWAVGLPANGPEPSAHSGVSAWSSNLSGDPRTFTQTFLLSPAIYLNGGSGVTLGFWQARDLTLYPGDVLHSARLFMAPVEDDTLIQLRSYESSTTGWEEEAIDLTPYLGQVVYFIWIYELASFDVQPRPGWLIDDVTILVDDTARGSIQIESNLAQAGVTVTGVDVEFATQREGSTILLANLAYGEYAVAFTEVPYYETPASQQVTVSDSQPRIVNAAYTFTDTNANLMSDAWEAEVFGEVSPARKVDTDTDADGASDYVEFVAATDPTSAASRLAAPQPAFRPDGQLQLTWPTVPSRDYRVEVSSDLLTWSPLSGWIRAEGTLTILVVPEGPPGACQMFRVQVHP